MIIKKKYTNKKKKKRKKRNETKSVSVDDDIWLWFHVRNVCKLFLFVSFFLLSSLVSSISISMNTYCYSLHFYFSLSLSFSFSFSFFDLVGGCNCNCNFSSFILLLRRWRKETKKKEVNGKTLFIWYYSYIIMWFKLSHLFLCVFVCVP